MGLVELTSSESSQTVALTFHKRYIDRSTYTRQTRRIDIHVRFETGMQ